MADPRDFQSAIQVTITPANAVGPQGASAPDIMIEYSIDGTGGWTSEQPSAEFMYFRVSTDGGYTWSEPIVYGTEQAAYLQALKAQQWAENPENVEVEPGKYSALHHATKAARSETNAEAAALDAAGSAAEAFGAAAPAWDSATVYNYNDVVSFDNGHTYRCIGDNVTTPPNTDGVDDEINWTRITVAPNGFFEYDTNYDLQPMIAPVSKSDAWILDENGDIMPQIEADLLIGESYRDLEFIDSVANFRLHSFVSTTQYVWLDGLTGTGSEGSGLYWRNDSSAAPDDGYSIIVDADGVRWERFDFGGATDSTTQSVDSVAELRTSTFLPTIQYIYLDGYYGKGTLGGGWFYRDSESVEADNGGTIFVDADGVRWKRSNVGNRYMASWFGATTDTTKISDNTPAIQNALDAMPDVGELVFEEEGIYDCYDTITMPDYDDHPNPQYSYVKGISLTGVFMQGGHNTTGNMGTTLRYVGPNKSVETPFFDFRGSYSDLSLGGIGRIYTGCIKDLTFAGLDYNNNIVGLWFSHAMDNYFSRCFFWQLTNGIRIDGHYYYSTFFRIHCRYCKYGFKALSLSNNASFYACVFNFSTIAGMSLNGNNDFDTGPIIDSCYFEKNQTAIEATIRASLTITNSYFESNYGYILNVSNPYDSTTVREFIVSMHNCYMHIDGTDIVSNKAVIKQTTSAGVPIAYSLENNFIRNTVIPPLDYFIYVISGDLKIKAENNRFMGANNRFPISSKIPLDTSYFNNDFTV